MCPTCYYNCNNRMKCFKNFCRFDKLLWLLALVAVVVLLKQDVSLEKFTTVSVCADNPLFRSEGRSCRDIRMEKKRITRYCQMPEFRRSCQKTCDACSGSDSESASEHEIASERKESCADDPIFFSDSRNCQYIGASGKRIAEYCYKTEFRRHCPKICGYCSMDESADHHRLNSNHNSFDNRTPESIDGDTLSFPPHPSKWVDDLASVLGCGMWKCAYYSNLSLQQNNNSPKYGYLISQERGKNHKQTLQVLEWTANEAHRLRNHYKIKHGLIGMPMQFNVTDPQIKRITHSLIGLNKQIPKYVATKMHKDINQTEESFQKDLQSTQLLIQPIELAPKYSIFWGCQGGKFDYANRMVEEFSQNNPSLSPSALDQMLDTMRFDLLTLETLMANKTDATCLQKDFQLMINPVSGSIIHIDLDRCFTNSGRNNNWDYLWNKTTGCSATLQSFLNNILVKRGGEKFFDAQIPELKKKRGRYVMKITPQPPPNITKIQ